jgi:hypothetical protein
VSGGWHELARAANFALASKTLIRMDSNVDENVSRFLKERFAGDIQIRNLVQIQIVPVHRNHDSYGRLEPERCCL